MPIEGSLRELALHDLFQLLHLTRKTGRLQVVQRATGTRGGVCFKAGAVVSAEIQQAAPRLGYLLLNAGKITEADLQRADKLREEATGRSWPEILRSLQVVSEEDLNRFVRFQVEECAYEILGWPDGDFSFGERALEESECVTWITVESLLMEGARRADELSALAKTVESPRAVPRLSERAVDGEVLDLAPQEWEVLGRVDGSSNVKSIAWSLGRNELEVSKIVARLTELGLLEIQAQDAGLSRPPHEVTLDHVERLIQRDELSQARRQLESVLEQHPEDARAHALVARVQERSGNLLAAAEAYERALDIDPTAAEARRRLGVMRLRLGHIDGAAREFTAFLGLDAGVAERERVQRALTAVRELQTIIDEFDERENT